MDCRNRELPRNLRKSVREDLDEITEGKRLLEIERPLGRDESPEPRKPS